MTNCINNTGYAFHVAEVLPFCTNNQLHHCFVFSHRDETQPEMIDDESATMPEGWLEDEPDLVSDPESSMPSDW